MRGPETNGASTPLLKDDDVTSRLRYNQPMSYRVGFTLIEVSIVLVIIGLLAGGVLVGRDLIEAAKIRQQITQIEQFKAAVNTFRAKYNALPGDLLFTQATAFGFTPRSGRIRGRRSSVS